MKTRIVLILCLVAGLIVVVVLANQYQWFAGRQNPIVEVKDLIPQPPMKTYPDAFPKELAFDMSPVDSIETGTSPTGTHQVAVRYRSPNPLGDFARAAKQMLEAKQWRITTGKNDPVPREIAAARGGEKVIVSLRLDPARDGTLVAVLYER